MTQVQSEKNEAITCIMRRDGDPLPVEVMRQIEKKYNGLPMSCMAILDNDLPLLNTGKTMFRVDEERGRGNKVRARLLEKLIVRQSKNSI